MKCIICRSVFVVCIGLLLFSGCSFLKPEKDQTINGTNLKLVSKYEPLHLYIYADTTSKNKDPDYVIFEGDKPLLLRENESSNRVQMVYSEKDFHITTVCDRSGQVLRRNALYDNSSMQIMYIDTNGNGFWDGLIIRETNAARIKVFSRSNLWWLPINTTNASAGSVENGERL